MRRQIGFWAAVASTIGFIAFDLAVAGLALTTPATPWTGIEAHAATNNSITIWLTILPCLLFAITFLIMVASLHEEAAPERRFFTRTALAFASVYAALVGLNYTIQLSVVRVGLQSGELEGLALWTMGNPHSIFWPLEIVGYGFMALAGLFLAPAVKSPWVSRMFLINAVVQVPATVAYFATGNPYHPLVIASLGTWGVTFPIATALLAIHVKRSTAQP